MQFPAPTKRLLFRNWSDADIELFAQMNMDPEVMEFFPALLNKDETAQAVQRIQKHFDDKGFGLYAVEKWEDSAFIGYIGFSTPRFASYFTPCVEIGWRLSRSNWGKGYATEGAKACLEFGFSTLGLSEIYSFTAVLNKRSEQVMKNIGMTKAGEFEHPLVPEGHPLKPHVLYKIGR